MVRIVAHRGGRALAIENTLTAFRNAVVLGVDAVEVDVLPSADGTLMAYHDDSLKRLTGVDRPVWALHDAELATVTIRPSDGSSGVGEPIPTLDAVDRILAPSMGFVIDVKHDDTEFPALFSGLVAFSRRVGPERVSVLSVHHQFLAALADAVPGIRPLFNYRTPVSGQDLYAFSGKAGLAVGMAGLTPAMMVEARMRDWPIYLWTPNTVGELRVALSMGVAAVITDNIGVACDLRHRDVP